MSRKNKDKPETGSAQPRPWAPYAALAGVIALVYGRAAGFGFTYLYDNILTERHTALADLGNIGVFFKGASLGAGDGAALYRPLTDASFMLDALWGGPAAWPYHLTNLLLHFAAAALLFRVFTRLAYGRGTALFCALVYAVHPALAQAVAWIPGRADLLLAAAGLASFEALLAWLSGRSRAALGLHLICLALALFARAEAALLLPLFVLFLAFLKAPGEVKSQSGWLWTGWAAVGALRLYAGGLVPAAEPEPWASLTALATGVAAAFGKALLPLNLGILQAPADLPWAAGVAALAAAAYAACAVRNRRPAFMVFGLLWFLLFVLPAAGAPGAAGQGFGEYRLYAALPGLLLFIAELAPGAWPLLAGRRAAYLGALVLALLAARAYVYAGAFRDKLSFWQAAAAASPGSAFNLRNYGAALFLEGDLARAEQLSLAAIALNPAEKGAHGNLGLIYMNSGRQAEAESEYLREAALDPGNANVRLNLGLLYYSRGLADKAEESWLAALALAPDFEKVLLNLAILNYRRGDRVRAKYYADQMQRRGYAVPADLLAALGAAEKK